MTAAYRMKGLGWFASCAAIALGFYLVSLQVAAERKKLDDVNIRIGAAQRDIRALETEFDTRANFAQLERWNGDTLSLAAPTAGQFLRDEAQLASIDVNAVGAPAVQTAALVVPSAPVAATVAATPVAIPTRLPAPAPAPVRMAALAVPAGVIRVAATHLVAPVKSARAMARIADAARAGDAVAKVRPQAVAMLDRKLLSDTTLGDLISRARAERTTKR